MNEPLQSSIDVCVLCRSNSAVQYYILVPTVVRMYELMSRYIVNETEVSEL